MTRFAIPLVLIALALGLSCAKEQPRIENPAPPDPSLSAPVPAPPSAPAETTTVPLPQSPTYAPPAASGPTVYVTNTGKKYHNAGCQYLRQSQHPVPLSQAKALGYTPCSKCSPPG